MLGFVALAAGLGRPARPAGRNSLPAAASTTITLPRRSTRTFGATAEQRATCGAEPRPSRIGVADDPQPQYVVNTDARPCSASADGLESLRARSTSTHLAVRYRQCRRRSVWPQRRIVAVADAVPLLLRHAKSSWKYSAPDHEASSVTFTPAYRVALDRVEPAGARATATVATRCVTAVGVTSRCATAVNARAPRGPSPLDWPTMTAASPQCAGATTAGAGRASAPAPALTHGGGRGRASRSRRTSHAEHGSDESVTPLQSASHRGGRSDLR